jgi:hypothetical protein
MEATVAERGQITLLKVELEGSRIILRKSVDDAISRARGKFALDGFDSAEQAVRTVRDEADQA